MKLKINGFENQINFSNNDVNILEVKDPKCFANLIKTLNDKINGLSSNEIFLLDENNNELDMSKEMYMLFDLFNIEYNSKKILTKIYDVISDNIKKNQDMEIQMLFMKLKSSLFQEINELPFEFTTKAELEIPEILKLLNLKIDAYNYETIQEKIEIMIELLSILKIANILVIPNLKLYLAEEEIVELYKYSLYNNINLMIIERNNVKKLTYEKILTIDENFVDQIT